MYGNEEDYTMICKLKYPRLDCLRSGRVWFAKVFEIKQFILQLQSLNDLGEMLQAYNYHLQKIKNDSEMYTLCCLYPYCRCFNNEPWCEHCNKRKAPSMTYCYYCSPQVCKMKALQKSNTQIASTDAYLLRKTQYVSTGINNVREINLMIRECSLTKSYKFSIVAITEFEVIQFIANHLKRHLSFKTVEGKPFGYNRNLDVNKFRLIAEPILPGGMLMKNTLKINETNKHVINIPLTDDDKDEIARIEGNIVPHQSVKLVAKDENSQLKQIVIILIIYWNCLLLFWPHYLITVGVLLIITPWIFHPRMVNLINEIFITNTMFTQLWLYVQLLIGVGLQIYFHWFNFPYHYKIMVLIIPVITGYLPIIIVWSKNYMYYRFVKRSQINHKQITSNPKELVDLNYNQVSNNDLTFLDLDEKEKECFKCEEWGVGDDFGKPVYFGKSGNVMMLPNMSGLKYNLTIERTQLNLTNTTLDTYPFYLHPLTAINKHKQGASVYGLYTTHDVSSFMSMIKNPESNWNSLSLKYLDNNHNQRDVLFHVNKQRIIMTYANKVHSCDVEISKTLVNKFMSMKCHKDSFQNHWMQVRASAQNNTCGSEMDAYYIASALQMITHKLNTTVFSSQFLELMAEVNNLKLNLAESVKKSRWYEQIVESLSLNDGNSPKIAYNQIYPWKQYGKCMGEFNKQALPLKPFSYVTKMKNTSCCSLRAVLTHTEANMEGFNEHCNSCVHNKIIALKERLLQKFEINQDLDFVVDGSLLRFASNLAKQIGEQVVVHKVINEYQWALKFDEPEKKADYIKKYDEMVNADDEPFDCRIDMIVKLETNLTKKEEEDCINDETFQSYIAPRGVFPFDRAYALVHGPYAHCISKVFTSLFGGKNNEYCKTMKFPGVFYTGAMNLNEIGHLFYEILHNKLGDDFIAIPDDQKRFEAHQNAVHMTIQYLIWYNLFKNFDKEVFKEFWLSYSKYIKNRPNLKKQYEDVKAYVEGTMGSGDGRTSTDNFWLNMVVHLFSLYLHYGEDLWNMMGRTVFIVGFGDDMCPIYSKHIAIPHLKYLKKIYDATHLDIESKMVTHYANIKYCSKVLMPAVDNGKDTYIAVQLPGNNLCKAYSTFKNPSDEQINYFNKTVAYAYKMNFNHVPSFKRRHKLMYKKYRGAIKPKRPIKTDLDNDYSIKNVSHVVKPSTQLDAWWIQRYGFEESLLNDLFLDVNKIYDDLNNNDYLKLIYYIDTGRFGNDPKVIADTYFPNIASNIRSMINTKIPSSESLPFLSNDPDDSFEVSMELPMCERFSGHVNEFKLPYIDDQNYLYALQNADFEIDYDWDLLKRRPKKYPIETEHNDDECKICGQLHTEFYHNWFFGPCAKCLSDEHATKDCKEKYCTFCRNNGHNSWQCDSKYCLNCCNLTKECTCEPDNKIEYDNGKISAPTKPPLKHNHLSKFDDYESKMNSLPIQSKYRLNPKAKEELSSINKFIDINNDPFFDANAPSEDDDDSKLTIEDLTPDWKMEEAPNINLFNSNKFYGDHEIMQGKFNTTLRRRGKTPNHGYNAKFVRNKISKY
jgi:hypothetical protein